MSFKGVNNVPKLLVLNILIQTVANLVHSSMELQLFLEKEPTKN